MNKRDQMRELIRVETEKNGVFTFLSWMICIALFVATEKGWVSAGTVLLIGQFAGLFAIKKSWKKETVQLKYLTNRDAKRHVHLMSIFNFLTFPILLILMFGWVTKQIETPYFIGLMVTGGVISVIGHKWYERYMVRLDENYVTERELKEEQKWGSA